MRFFCPRCQTAIVVAGEAPTVSCTGCGLNVDLALVNTSAGRPQLPIVMDYTSEQIGPFRLEQSLGSGGMGTVYKAVDTRNGSTVALKLLFPQFCALEDLVGRFRREAQALRELVHPRIVRLIEEGESNGHHYLAMEYIEGEDLERLLRHQRPTPEDSLGIASEICEALAAAHSRGIVHRDLKPANVIRSKTGIRVLDFGIAQIATEDRTLTRSDAILGTVNYMSPEQRSGGRVDQRSDLFSLGVILYFMLTGKLPLGAFEPASRLNLRLSKGFDRLISRALQSNPENRFQSAAEMSAEIERLRRPNGRPRAWLAGLFLVLALVAGAAGYLALNRNRPESGDAKSIEVESVVAAENRSAPPPEKAGKLSAPKIKLSLPGPSFPETPAVTQPAKPAKEKIDLGTRLGTSKKPGKGEPYGRKEPSGKNKMDLKKAWLDKLKEKPKEKPQEEPTKEEPKGDPKEVQPPEPATDQDPPVKTRGTKPSPVSAQPPRDQTRRAKRVGSVET